jgi:hypothetical protein
VPYAERRRWFRELRTLVAPEPSRRSSRPRRSRSGRPARRS